MAFSDSTDFQVDRDDIINHALKLCGVVEPGGTGTSNIVSDAAEILNMIIKDWAKHGLHLWTKDEIVLFPVKDQRVYTIGGSSADRMALVNSEFIETELDGAASSSDTQLTVDSTTGMAGSDVIGVQTDDSGIHWTTISSVDDSTTLTLSSGLDDDAADGNNVYTYTNAYTHKFNRIWYAQRKQDGGDASDDSWIPINVYSHREYQFLSSKNSSGPVLHIYYTPAANTGDLYVWQVPDDDYTEELIYLSVDRYIDDFDSATDDVNMPKEWYLALVYNLAALGPGISLGVSDSRYQRITTWSQKLLEDLLDWDAEYQSIYLQPATSQRRTS